MPAAVIDVLLAKSVSGGEWKRSQLPYGVRLEEHLCQVYETGMLLCDVLEQRLERQSGISGKAWRNAFVVAAAGHDLGKMALRFQELVRGSGTVRQSIWHEAVSAWLMEGEGGLHKALNVYWERCALSLEELRWAQAAVLMAVAGHHYRWSASGIASMQLGNRYPLVTEPALLEPLRQWLENILGADISWEPWPLITTETDRVRAFQAHWQDKVEGLCEEMTQEQRQALSLFRGLFTAADMLGSARCGSREEWLERLDVLSVWLRNESLPLMLEQWIDTISSGLTDDAAVTEFQQRTADAGSDAHIVLAIAGCGTGKTLAAYKWARQAKCTSLCFAYPTTATATQGYIEYGSRMDGSHLLHSRAKVDWELMENGTEATGHGLEREDRRQQERIAITEAMERLSAPLTICTIDMLVGWLQHYRSSLLLLPRLLQAGIVVDEIHSLDQEAFRHLLELVIRFNVPMLLMTATLQEERKQMLLRAAKVCGKQIKIVEGPASLEALPRYRLALQMREPAEEIAAAFEAGRKVLVVCNTVGRARRLYRMLKLLLPEDRHERMFLYHSRFKYEDRYHRQARVVKTFRTPGPCLAVTTQLCEMSFDLSADSLFTECAPISSLIQRMGRLFRHVRDMTGLKDGPGMAVIWMPEGCRPYTQEQLDTAWGWAQTLSARASLSQRDLSKAWLALNERPLAAVRASFDWDVLADSRRGKSIRGEGAPTMPVLTQSDAAKARQSGGDAWTEAQKRSLPLSFRSNVTVLERWRYVHVVPDEEVWYTEEVGGMWAAEARREGEGCELEDEPE